MKKNKQETNPTAAQENKQYTNTTMPKDNVHCLLCLLSSLRHNKILAVYRRNDHPPPFRTHSNDKSVLKLIIKLIW